VPEEMNFKESEIIITLTYINIILNKTKGNSALILKIYSFRISN